MLVFLVLMVSHSRMSKAAIRKGHIMQPYQRSQQRDITKYMGKDDSIIFFQSFLFRLLIRMSLWCVLGWPHFLPIYQTPFFGILGVCMSCPEEDFDQGGHFLLRRERFIKFFIKRFI